MQPNSASSAPPQPAGITLKTARPWRVATVALLTLLVLVAVFGNQWVTNKIDKHYQGARFADNAARSLRIYQWRFSPSGGHDRGHVWLGNLALVGTVLLLTLLLVAVIARGKGGFGQAFTGTWLVVVAATVLARYVRATVIDPGEVGLTSRSKLNAVVFSSLGPSAATLFAALAFGFVVALVAGLAAPLSRRTEVIAPPAAAASDESMLPSQDDDAPPIWARVDAPYEPAPSPMAYPPSPDEQPAMGASMPSAATPAGSSGQDEGHTAVLPAVDAAPVNSRVDGPVAAEPGNAGFDNTAAADETTQLPAIDARSDESVGEQTTQLPRIDANDQTAQFPRPDSHE